MRVATIATILVLLGVSGLGVAAPGGDEAHTLDLSSLPGGIVIYLKCSNLKGSLLKDCGALSVWQEGNPAQRLQTIPTGYQGITINPDIHLLG